MIRAAAQSGDATKLETIASVARQTNPNSVEEIDALVKGFTTTARPSGCRCLHHRAIFRAGRAVWKPGPRWRAAIRARPACTATWRSRRKV
ncbi:hypothetical protein E6W36_11230 [Hankyongella ginsenosidimutans]|uniref:Uncharacterized protein n=1 Tax=Hankyongella ginsenosidimutans TaxID=1763828 RepID=A0A4D7C488_9SPHN|nr:hypothetical protein [Hankyongella ginsenosidimutans]QCI79871.1 hypothetical protein E6W36_11230 [Hankyongella ginsenosidimutans]